MSFFQLMIIGYICTAAMFVSSGRRHQAPAWKNILLAFVTMFVGYAGCILMRFIESGTFRGMSFFGTVFIVPVVIPLLARLMRLHVTDVMDACGISMGVIAMLEKLNCVQEGCCRGMQLTFTTSAQVYYLRFPSQIVESLMGLMIAMVLFRLFLRGEHEGKLYPLFLVIYGVLRFLLNLLRETEPFVWILPAGNFWGFISIGAGLLMLKKGVYHPVESTICDAGE